MSRWQSVLLAVGIAVVAVLLAYAFTAATHGGVPHFP